MESSTNSITKREEQRRDGGGSDSDDGSTDPELGQLIEALVNAAILTTQQIQVQPSQKKTSRRNNSQDRLSLDQGVAFSTTNVIEIFSPDEELRANGCANLLSLFRVRKTRPSRYTNSCIRREVARMIMQTLSYHMVYEDFGEANAASILYSCRKILRSAMVHCPLQELEAFCGLFVGIAFKFGLERQIFDILYDLFLCDTSELNWTCIKSVFTGMFNLMQSKYTNHGIAALSAAPIHGGELQQTTSTQMPSSHAVENWLLVMQVAIVRVSTLKDDRVVSKTCHEWLPKMFKTLLELQKICADNHLDFDQTIHNTYRTLLEVIVAEVCKSEELVQQLAPQLDECFRVVATALEADRWRAQHIAALMFDIAGRNCAGLLKGIVKSFRVIEENLCSDRIEHAVAAAIRVFGPEFVLEELTLKTEDGSLNMDKLYLIPLLKANIRSSSILYFFKEIWPLAVDCRERSEDETLSEVNRHDMLDTTHQLIELLPVFCADAPDIETYFEYIAVLVCTFIRAKGLRSPVLTALYKCLSNAKFAKNQQQLDAIKQNDKNLCSVLSNWCLTAPITDNGDELDKAMAWACLRLLVSISKQTLITKDTILNAVANLNVDGSTDVKLNVLQFIIVVLPWLNCQQIRIIYNEYLRYLPEIRDEAEHAAAYHLLKRMCSSVKNGGCKTFVATNQKRICSLLWDCLVKTPFYDNKPERFKILAYLMKAQTDLRPMKIQMEMTVRAAIDVLRMDIWNSSRHLMHRGLQLLSNTGDEASDEAKEVFHKYCEVEKKMVNLAYDVLVWAFKRCLPFGEMNSFLHLVTGDLFSCKAAAAEYVPGVILALACLVRMFSGEFGPYQVDRLTNMVLTKAKTSKTLLVHVAALEYFKVYFVLLPGTVTQWTYKKLAMIFKQLAAMPLLIKLLVKEQLQMALEVLPIKYRYAFVRSLLPEGDFVLNGSLFFAYSPWRQSIGGPEMKDAAYFRDRTLRSFQFRPGNTRLEAILTE